MAAVARPILRHRLILNFTAQSEGITVDDVIRELVKAAAKDDGSSLSSKFQVPGSKLRNPEAFDGDHVLALKTSRHGRRRGS